MNPEAVANHKKTVVTTVDFRDIPDQSPLFLDFLYADTAETRRFWPNRDLTLNAYSEDVISGYQTDRHLLCKALETENAKYGAGANTFENIDRLRQTDCVAVVTGQQAGLFSGPAYTVYKALSTIKLAANLREAGVNAVPVFWIASEDHDFDEIGVAYFRNRNKSLTRVQIPRNEAFEGFPVGEIPVGPEIKNIVGGLFNEIESFQFTESLCTEILDSYEPRTDLSTAFGRLMTSWLGRYGLVFANPLNPVVRKLSAPVYSQAIGSYLEIRTGLVEANRHLAEAGYHVQVEVEEDYLPLFHISKKGTRSALRESGGIVRSKDGSLDCTVRELVEMVNDQPGSFSPNALFRPIVQDFVFPTVCYVGGAAEISYFAQNRTIYNILDRPVTPIRHRATVTILDARHRRTLEAYDLSVNDLWLGYAAVLERIISERADPKTQKKLIETEEIISRQMRSLQKTISGLDPGLAAGFEKRQEKIMWHIRAMKGKFKLFEERRNSDLIRRLGDLYDAGFPRGGPQERTICFADHLNRYGLNLFEWLYPHIDETGHEHRIVCL